MCEKFHRTNIHHLAFALFEAGLEKKAAQQSDLGLLLAELLSEKLITEENVSKGLEELFKYAEDLIVDMPDMWNSCGRIFGKTMAKMSCTPYVLFSALFLKLS